MTGSAGDVTGTITAIVRLDDGLGRLARTRPDLQIDVEEKRRRK